MAFISSPPYHFSSARLPPRDAALDQSIVTRGEDTPHIDKTM